MRKLRIFFSRYTTRMKTSVTAKRRRNPAPPQPEAEDDDFDALFGGSGAPDGSPGKQQPVQRNAANARERARMRVLSRAFCRLKTSLPWVPRDTKLSKLDTLRLASTYIAHLRTVLKEDGDDGDFARPEKKGRPVHPITLTWPFTISNKPGSGGEDSNTSVPLVDHRDHMADPQTTFQNYPSCEYMAKPFSDSTRRDAYGHYLH